MSFYPALLFTSLNHQSFLLFLMFYHIPIGRGGLTIRELAAESGAKISMTSKDEAIFTQERILSISGGKSSCIKCLSMVS